MSRRIESCMLAVALLVSAACGGANGDGASTQRALALSEDATGTSANAHVNQEIDITLQTVGPGEYSVPSMSSESVAFLDVSVPPAQNPGGVKQEFRFKAESVGTAEITIPHTVKKDVFDVVIVVE